MVKLAFLLLFYNDEILTKDIFETYFITNVNFDEIIWKQFYTIAIVNDYRT